MAGSRTGEQRTNRMNRLPAPANHPTNVSATKLQFKDRRSSVRNFG
jgi:hypothetical protein